MFAAQKAKHNMMCDYSDDEKENRPPPNEFELKVRRSLDKMSVPDWFLNKKSANPKILRNNASIEYWSKPWKKGKTEKSGKDVRNLHIKPTLGANHPADTHKMKRNFDEPKDQTKKTKTKLLNGSHTFPKASPSNKIKNINIVLPTSTPPPVLYDDSDTSSAVRDVGEEEEKEIIVDNSIVSEPTKVPEELPVTAKPTTEIISEKLPPSLARQNVERLQNDTTSSGYGYYSWKSATSTLSPSNSSIDNKPIETTLRSSPQFCTSSPRDSFYTASDSSVDRLLVSKNKSTELQKILRETKTTCYEKGLVKRIIEELNKDNDEISRKTYFNTYLSNTSYHKVESSNRVKKLVDAFEKQMVGMHVEDEGEKTYSDEDINSAAVSTSISYEDSDSEYETSLATVVRRSSEVIKHGAYWIRANPTRRIGKRELPIASSLLSVELSCLQSPSVSPIPHYTNNKGTHLGWGLTYTKKGSKRLFHIDETDSGYFEKPEKIESKSLNIHKLVSDHRRSIRNEFMVDLR